MPAIKLSDLADVAIGIYADKYGYKKEEIKKENVGLRAGEKMFEELMTETEAKKAFEMDDLLIIPPQVKLTGVDQKGMDFTASDYKNARKCQLKEYSSKNIKLLSKKEIKKLLFDPQNMKQ